MAAYSRMLCLGFGVWVLLGAPALWAPILMYAQDDVIRLTTIQRQIERRLENVEARQTSMDAKISQELQAININLAQINERLSGAVSAYPTLNPLLWVLLGLLGGGGGAAAVRKFRNNA